MALKPATEPPACVFAGYDRFIEVLPARMTAIELDAWVSELFRERGEEDPVSRT